MTYSNSLLRAVRPRALLILADGTRFFGDSIGTSGTTTGELVFNTAMTGYQEILTDPSYAKQIVTLTYPHIGNVGANLQDEEASKIWASGLVIRDLSPIVSNFRAQKDLSSYLKERGIIAISGVDTRHLTRLLREKGAQNGCILALEEDVALDEHKIEQALYLAKTAPSMAGQDLAKVVSTTQSYAWRETSWTLDPAKRKTSVAERFHVVAYDFGIKRNILRLLADRGCRITVVPAQTSATEALALKPNGIFLSNGPGDPEPCDYAIAATKEFLNRKIPLFGICLGHQLLALASGAKTLKMKFGHHGANHPVQNLDTKRVYITSQNHGFAVEASTLPSQLRITHLSLFDGSIQGLQHTDAPAFCFQGHPEASPGPHEIMDLFDQFIALMEKH
ncbi:MAG: glutamine-hydrolyzing carbamoyl-phosphate synthase small subunit [Burkholderiaceae bacterium]|nr:glutamine-hydrolyzing carbamoyl-phosphate synthase small subunit [Burkholderiaceae bacterium]